MLGAVAASSVVTIRPALANIRSASDKLNAAFDPQTAANIRAVAERLNAVSAKLDAGLTDLRPVFEDLGGPSNKVIPTTNLGQSLLRINRIAADFALLTAGLSDGKGRLNSNGSLQKLVLNAELYDNLARMSGSATAVFELAKPAVKSIGEFARKIAADPAVLGRGVLQR